MERPLQNLGKVSPLGMRETVDCMNHFTFGSTVSANKNMNQIQEQFWLYLRSSLHGSVLSIWDALFPANWSFGNDSGQSIQISYTLITAIFRRLFFSQLKFIFKKIPKRDKLGPVWLGFFPDPPCPPFFWEGVPATSKQLIFINKLQCRIFRTKQNCLETR